MKISVCMATYNGERFIHDQLTSILGQLCNDDEVVIVDDASSDRTVAIIEGFCDSRIRILQQPRNCGVRESFGRALREGKGEIIFLSDQDDVWRSDKVSKIKNAFSLYPDFSLVLSDTSIIDASGKIIAETRFTSRTFKPGTLHNIVRNNYLGCSMAFRRSILDYCLPFPADIPMHDMWIGIVNNLIGKTGFIAEPLMSYRRHDSNASPYQHHAPLLQMIRWRFALVKNLGLLFVCRLLRERNAMTKSGIKS